MFFTAKVQSRAIEGRGNEDALAQFPLVDDLQFVAGFHHRDQAFLGAEVEVVVGNDRGSAVLAKSTQPFAIEQLAVGGIRGGQVHGSSDNDSAYPVTSPVSPEDMLATIHHSLGISPDSEIYDAVDRPHRVVDGTPLLGLFS